MVVEPTAVPFAGVHNEHVCASIADETEPIASEELGVGSGEDASLPFETLVQTATTVPLKPL